MLPVGVIAVITAEAKATDGVVSEWITAREITGTAIGVTAAQETTGVAAAGTSVTMVAGGVPEEANPEVTTVMPSAGVTAGIASKVIPITISVLHLHAMTTDRHEGGEMGVAEVVAGMTQAMIPAHGIVRARPGTKKAWSDMLAKCQLDGTKSQLRTSPTT